MPIQFYSSAFIYCVVRDVVPVPLWIALGALLQLLVLRHLTHDVALAWPTVILGPPLLYTLFFSLLPYRFRRPPPTVLPGRFTASLMADDDELHNVPVELRPETKCEHLTSPRRPLSLLLIGARYNGPTGFLGRGMSHITFAFKSMVEELEADPSLGLITGQTFQETTDWRNNAVWCALYFTSSTAVQQFARRAKHSTAWRNYFDPDNAQRHLSCEIFHELYSIDANSWEAIYVNSTVRGIASAHTRGEDDEQGKPTWKSAVRKLDPTSSRSASRMKGDDQEDSETYKP